MSDIRHFANLVRSAPRPDVSILLMTCALTVFADLVIAVNAGVVLSALLFMRRMSQSVNIRNETEDHLQEAGEGMNAVAPDIVVYGIDGPFFFGVVEKLERILESIQSQAKILVLRMGQVPFVDATDMQALSELISDCRKRKVRIKLTELRGNVQAKLARVRIIDTVGKDNVFGSLQECLDSVKQAPPVAPTVRKPA